MRVATDLSGLSGGPNASYHRGTRRYGRPQETSLVTLVGASFLPMVRMAFSSPLWQYLGGLMR